MRFVFPLVLDLIDIFVFMFRFEVMDPINKIERRRKEAETLVFWDINNCPVPKDCDAGLVGSCIESALKKAGHCKGDIGVCFEASFLLELLFDASPAVSSFSPYKIRV